MAGKIESRLRNLKIELPKAAAPLYLKSHSYGEYVFDHGWADAYERAGEFINLGNEAHLASIWADLERLVAKT